MKGVIRESRQLSSARWPSAKAVRRHQKVKPLGVIDVHQHQLGGHLSVLISTPSVRHQQRTLEQAHDAIRCNQMQSDAISGHQQRTFEQAHDAQDTRAVMSTCMQGRSSVAISVPLSKRMMRRIRATRTIRNQMQSDAISAPSAADL